METPVAPFLSSHLGHGSALGHPGSPRVLLGPSTSALLHPDLPQLWARHQGLCPGSRGQHPIPHVRALAACPRSPEPALLPVAHEDGQQRPGPSLRPCLAHLCPSGCHCSDLRLSLPLPGSQKYHSSFSAPENTHLKNQSGVQERNL